MMILILIPNMVFLKLTKYVHLVSLIREIETAVITMVAHSLVNGVEQSTTKVHQANELWNGKVVPNVGMDRNDRLLSTLLAVRRQSCYPLMNQKHVDTCLKWRATQHVMTISRICMVYRICQLDKINPLERNRFVFSYRFLFPNQMTGHVTWWKPLY